MALVCDLGTGSEHRRILGGGARTCQVTATAQWTGAATHTHTEIQACTHTHKNCIVNTASIYDVRLFACFLLIHKDRPVSTSQSQVLGLKVCATTVWLFAYFFHLGWP